jgi:hypothetical protein
MRLIKTLLFIAAFTFVVFSVVTFGVVAVAVFWTIGNIIGITLLLRTEHTA